MTEWSNLPNAAHIDRILRSVGTQYLAWRSACDVVDNRVALFTTTPSWNTVVKEATEAEWDAHFEAANSLDDTVEDDVWQAARNAIIALVVWYRSAELLQLPPEAVRVLAALGDDAAVLILPAVIALSREHAET